MLKQYFLLLVLSLTLVTAYDDTDMDGVINSKDKCPNTPMSELVDATGCTPNSHPWRVILGAQTTSGNYGGTQTITSNSALATLAYQTPTLGAFVSTSYFSSGASDPTVTTGGEGLGDTYVGASFTQYTSLVTLSYFTSIKLATASTLLGTGQNDYAFLANINWQNNRFNLLSSIGYTFTGNSDTITYNDIKSASVQAGYLFSPKLYSSIAYNFSDAFLPQTASIQNLSFFASYSFNPTLFMTANYAYGLTNSAPQHALGLSLGSSF